MFIHLYEHVSIHSFILILSFYRETSLYPRRSQGSAQAENQGTSSWPHNEGFLIPQGLAKILTELIA